MTISATETGTKITGDDETPVEISTIEITDPDTDETSTLDMSLVNSSGMDDITAGTDYTLALDGFFNGFTAFVDPASDQLKTLAKLKFSASKRAFDAFRSAKNTEQIQFTPIGDLENVAVDENGYFDFTENRIARVTVECAGRLIDSDDTNNGSVIMGIRIIV
jgi:hypothetical protein